MFTLGSGFTVTVTLGEQESTSGYFVLQRDSGYGDRAVLEDNFALTRIDGMEDDLVCHLIAMIVQQRLHQLLQIRRCVDMQRLRTPHHTEGGDEADQSEAMVAVQVGDEDVIQPRRTECHTPEPNLTALAAINHERLVAEFQHLTGGGVLECGQGTAAT